MGNLSTYIHTVILPKYTKYSILCMPERKDKKNRLKTEKEENDEITKRNTECFQNQNHIV